MMRGHVKREVLVFQPSYQSLRHVGGASQTLQGPADPPDEAQETTQPSHRSIRSDIVMVY